MESADTPGERDTRTKSLVLCQALIRNIKSRLNGDAKAFLKKETFRMQRLFVPTLMRWSDFDKK